MIGVPEVVSDIGDLPPRDVRMTRLHRLGDVARRFAENLEEAFEGGADDAVALDIRQITSVKQPSDVGGRLQDVT